MNKRIPIFLGLVLVSIAVWLLLTSSSRVRNGIERLDDFSYDLQLRTRIMTEHLKPASPVAIVDIDDKSLSVEGRWPWPRSKMAALVDQLQQQGAAVIAFDIFFSEKQINIVDPLITELSKRNLLDNNLSNVLKKNQSLFDDDAIFAKSLAKAPAILAIGFLPRVQTENLLPKPLFTLSTQDEQQLNLIKAEGYISNIPILQQVADGGGFINIFGDLDGIIRHAPLLIEYHGDVYPALALQSVLTFLNEKVTLLTPSYGKSKKLEGIQVGAHIIPTDEKGQVLIPYIGRSYTFPFYSAVDVLQNHIPKGALSGKIIFIGTSATGLGDLQTTPIEHPFPGVEVQATLVNGILLNNFSYKPAWTLGANLFLTLLFGLIAACLFPYLGPRTLGAIIIILPPALLFLNNGFWKETGLILSLILPAILTLLISLLNIIYGYLFETRRRERLKLMFGQYVPPKHIDAMLRSGSTFGMRGEDREMTVLFSDIRNFTGMSEGMSASELVDMLNTYFTHMTKIIFKHKGTIDKYVGDLIMAFWGAPLRDRQHVRNALEAALEMQAHLKILNPILASKEWPELKMGMGINAGMMSVGDMGSEFRRNYTVLGDAVNLASRIESLTKFYGVDIVVTEAVLKDQTKFVFRKLDRVRVHGKQSAIDIYELVGTQAEITPEVVAELELYHDGLELYFLQKWDEAFGIMDHLHQTYYDKKLYHLFTLRIKEFKKHPLPEDWDGVYVHLTK